MIAEWQQRSLKRNNTAALTQPKYKIWVMQPIPRILRGQGPCLLLDTGSLFSGRNYWNAVSQEWTVECPTMANYSTYFLLFPQTGSPTIVCRNTSSLFTPREVWQGASHHWIFERLSMWACVCACILCGNVGRACSPSAMPINSLKTKGSPFFSPLQSFASLPCSFWVVIAEQEGGGGGAREQGCWREVHD